MPAQNFIAAIQREILEPAVTLVAILAFMLFVWGVVEMIRNGASDEARTKGQKHMIWGIVGLVVIFGANAIVSIIGAIVGGFR